LARPLGQAHHRYALEINRRHRWTGHLWQERFASFPMDEPHLMAAIHYVLLNPVRAGLAQATTDWPYSSAELTSSVSRTFWPTAAQSPNASLTGGNCSISTTQLFDIEQLRLGLRAVIGEKRKRYEDTEERSIEDAVGTAFALVLWTGITVTYSP